MQAGCCEVKRKERNMATVWTDILSDVFIVNNFNEWNFIVNNIFIKEFYCKRGFLGIKFCSNLSVVQANSNWKLEFFGSIDGVVQGFRISVLKTFGTGFDICEVGIIDFGRWWNQAVFCGCLLIPTIGDMDYVSDFSCPYRLKLSRIIAPMGQNN